MICPICSANLAGPRQHSERFSTAYYCNSCHSESIIDENVKQGDYVVETGRYRFYCRPKTNTATIQELYMDIETDTSIIYRWYDVVQLPSIPNNLSEQTVDSKLKMYLLFS